MDNNIITGKLIYNSRVITSEELNIVVKRIEKIFISYLEDDEEIIAIALPRSPEMIATIFAALKNNITFLILDMEQPQYRLEYMLEKAEIKTVIASNDVMKKYVFNGKRVVSIDSLMTEKNVNLVKNPRKNDIAYVLFTSGTTGMPKAVAIKKEGLNNFLEAIPQIIEFNEDDIICCFTSGSFDIFFLEILIPLYRGMTVVLASEKEKDNARKIIKLIRKNKVTMLQMTPSRLKLLQTVDERLECLMKIKKIMVGGEAFPLNILKLLQRNKKLRIYNMYGPTETTIWSTVSELTDKEAIDVGKPILNTNVYLLDENNDLVCQGDVGEICISGKGVAAGYLNDSILTQKSFVSIGSERIYKTGDLGKYDANNNLLCLGRKDEQIKIYGHRVELNDIEANLEKMEYVNGIAACYEQIRKAIVVFYISKKDIQDKELFEFAKLMLPSYMRPIKYIRVDQFIYTSSGKIDKKEMLSTYFYKKNEITNNLLYDQITNDIIDIIYEIQGDIIDSIDLNTKIEEIIINSIDYVSLIVEIEEKFDIEFDIDKLAINEFSDIESLVMYVKNKIGG